MRKVGILVSALIVSCLMGWPVARAESQHGHAAHGGKMEGSGASSCHSPVRVTEEAERQPGGALFEGSPASHHEKHRAQMPEMKGAHTDHKPKHDGAFFMAPDKIHHLEGMYSEHCGFQLYLFNAFTKPIRVGRFRAFIKVVPNSDDEAEIIRFLSPNKDRTVLAAPIGDAVTRPFKIELFLKFPEADDPELFTVHVPVRAEAAKEVANAINLMIKKGKIEGKKVIRVTEGETVNLRWMSDEPVKLHLHGYDIEKTVKPGASVLMTFKAYATGRFPVTAHGFGGHSHGGGHSEKNLLYLEVHPK